MTEDKNYRRFDPPEQTQDEGEPLADRVQFDIGDDHFVCLDRRMVPAGALRKLSTTQVWTVAASCDFIEGVLEDKDSPDDETPTQIERFRRATTRKDKPVNQKLLGDIVIWLMEAITDRPTKSRSGSTAGRAKTAGTSKASSSGGGKGKSSAA